MIIFILLLTYYLIYTLYPWILNKDKHYNIFGFNKHGETYSQWIERMDYWCSVFSTEFDLTKLEDVDSKKET